jgi:hypothetical protein
LAVRFARGLAADGTVVGTRRVGTGPTGIACPEDRGNSVYAFLGFYGGLGGRPKTTPVSVAEAGGHSLRVADGHGVKLCSGLGKLHCQVPPVDAYGAELRRRGRVVGGILAGDVASVDLRLSTGLTQSAETTDGAAYTGRYAGHLRFLAAELPAGAFVTSAIAHDVKRRRLGAVYVYSLRVSTQRRQVRPGLVLRRTAFSNEGDASTTTCLAPKHAQSRVSEGLCTFGTRPISGGQAFASVSCKPRRAVLAGSLTAARCARACGASRASAGCGRSPSRATRP